MLGATEESSSVFASCSEAGANESWKSNELKKENDEKKAVANAEAVR